MKSEAAANLEESKASADSRRGDWELIRRRERQLFALEVERIFGDRPKMRALFVKPSGSGLFATMAYDPREGGSMEIQATPDAVRVALESMIKKENLESPGSEAAVQRVRELLEETESAERIALAAADRLLGMFPGESDSFLMRRIGRGSAASVAIALGWKEEGAEIEAARVGEACEGPAKPGSSGRRL